jgi:hypothetical protein
VPPIVQRWFGCCLFCRGIHCLFASVRDQNLTAITKFAYQYGSGVAREHEVKRPLVISGRASWVNVRPSALHFKSCHRGRPMRRFQRVHSRRDPHLSHVGKAPRTANSSISRGAGTEESHDDQRHVLTECGGVRVCKWTRRMNRRISLSATSWTPRVRRLVRMSAVMVIKSHPSRRQRSVRRHGSRIPLVHLMAVRAFFTGNR